MTRDKRIDLAVWVGGKHHYVDVCIKNDYAVSNRNRSAEEIETEARNRKHHTYAEQARADDAQLTVFTLHASGRWSPDAVRFVKLLAAEAEVNECRFDLELMQTISRTVAWANWRAISKARTFITHLRHGGGQPSQMS